MGKHRAACQLWRIDVTGHRRRDPVNAPFIALALAVIAWGALILFLGLHSW